MILLINNHSRDLPQLKERLSGLGADFLLRDQGSMLSDVEKKDVDGVILSGGTPFIDEKIYFSRIRADIESLLNYDVPVLGICMGHEIIAEVFGGEVIKMGEPSEYNDLEVTIKERSAIFRGLPDKIKVYEHHSRYVKDVGTELVAAAGSEKNEIEAVFHRDRPVFGVQFHPERSGKVGRKILENFLRLCKTRTG